jgi:hypothetical protein
MVWGILVALLVIGAAALFNKLTGRALNLSPPKSTEPPEWVDRHRGRKPPPWKL